MVFEVVARTTFVASCGTTVDVVCTDEVVVATTGVDPAIQDLSEQV